MQQEDCIGAVVPPEGVSGGVELVLGSLFVHIGVEALERFLMGAT